MRTTSVLSENPTGNITVEDHDKMIKHLDKNTVIISPLEYCCKYDLFVFSI